MFVSNINNVVLMAQRNEMRNCQKYTAPKQMDKKVCHDINKYDNTKGQRKVNKEDKRMQLVERKKENRILHDNEIASMIVGNERKFKVEGTKVPANEQCVIKRKPKFMDPIPENNNRITCNNDEETTTNNNYKVYRIDDIRGDKHLLNRVKSAYLVFEQRQMPVMKAKHPQLRFTQLQQMISKEFDKSPQNPKNQVQVLHIK